MTASVLGCPKQKILWTGEKTMMATWAPHRMQSSLAFLNSPALRFEKVTCKAVKSKPLKHTTMATHTHSILMDKTPMKHVEMCQHNLLTALVGNLLDLNLLPALARLRCLGSSPRQDHGSDDGSIRPLNPNWIGSIGRRRRKCQEGFIPSSLSDIYTHFGRQMWP